MRDDADPDLMATWARGWTLTRDAPLPDPIPGGWRIDANRPDGRWRFLYPCLCGEAVARAEVMLPDTVALKIAAAPERVAAALTHRWPLCEAAYVMTGRPGGGREQISLTDGYRLTSHAVLRDVTLIEIRTRSGELAASGYLGIVDDLAIFDRIRTENDHQRRGLGTAVMTALGQFANDAGAKRWALVATLAGRTLYETIGWRVHAPYTTVLIPASE